MALESSVKASKAYDFQTTELTFVNNDLKAQVHDLQA